jgi:hypothetical protein
MYVLSALGIRFGLSYRPPRAAGRPSVSATWRTNRFLLSSRSRRLTYFGLWIPNGLIIGCESLYPSYAPQAAGTLFASSALGMLTGNFVVGRFVSAEQRSNLAAPLLLLLATPYLFFAMQPGLLWAALAVFVASHGFGATLVQQESLMAITPDRVSGQALGLHYSGALTMQGVSAVLAGTVAQLTSPATAMTTTAAVSISVTLILAAAGKRRENRSETPSDTELATTGALDPADAGGVGEAPPPKAPAD